MLKRFIHHLLERRHYWRTVGFSELAELYANRLLRLMAVNLVSGITGIYMYQLGYHIWMILVYFGVYFALRALAAIPAAYFIGRVGPKHASLISSFLYIPGLIALTQLENLGVTALVIHALCQSLSVTMYSISHHVNFSKIKHSDHAGKELGFMYVVEKVGAGLSPLLGGMIAYLFGPEATLWTACLLAVVAAGPLFLTPEPIMTHQRVIFRGINRRLISRSLTAMVAMGVDQLSSVAMWSLYVAIAIFGTTSDIVYAQVGGLMTLAFVASLVFSRLYGAIIDRRRGGELLRASVIGDSLVHIVRPFVSTPLGIIFVNTANEAVSAGHSMPFLKGQYDMADSLPGYRIAYIALTDMFLCTGAALFAFIVAGLVSVTSEVSGLQLGYVVAAVAVLPIMRHGFPALRSGLIAKRHD